MKRILKPALLIAAALALVSALSMAGSDAWFDMENCSFCKNLAEDPKLMHHMTWEQYSISNGIIAVTTVEADYAESFAKCQAGMKAAGEKAMKGEQLPMCNSCTSLGMIMMKGIKTEDVDTKNGEIWIMTAEDPELVAELQEWAQRNMAEVAKLEAADH